MTFKIKDIIIENQIVLAPMAGVSNSAFRRLARMQGAGLVFAEMVSDKGIVYQNEKTIHLLYMTQEEKPMAQQIFGSDLKSMVEAAKFIDAHSHCDIIDINMGCPVPKVALRAQAGASLMKDPEKIYDIVSCIVKEVSKPVTVKIRSGWDEHSINAVTVAKQIEKAGAHAITVHARTRSQGYEGRANLDIIKAVKQAVSLPVIGNGDVIDGPSAKHMLTYTGCDAVMVGRAALGNPWIFNEISHYLKTGEIIKRPKDEDIKKMMIEHLEKLIDLKGEHIALLEMRSHGPWYLKGMSQAATLRKQLSQTKSKEEFMDHVNQFFNER